jgi:hypothetical protein
MRDCIGCFGEYIAEYAKWPAKWTEEQKHRLGRRSLILLIIGIGAGLLSLIQTNALSGEVIGSLGEQGEEAGRKVKLLADSTNAALLKSSQAVTSSENALLQSSNAEGASSNALSLARGARQEADSFEKDIASAMKQATEAEAHLKDALARAEAAATLAKGYEKQIEDAKRDASEAKSLLAVARQLAAEARQQAGEAVVGVSQLKANRSLSNAAELSARLKEFENTEYAFSGVFADEESVGLLKQIDEALRRAGWRRAKGTHRFPALEVFGKDDDVNEIVATGVQISVESPESLATLQALPLVKLPPPLNAAIALNLGLSSGISPQDARAKLVNVQPGTSKIVQISVGKKP